MKRTEFGNIVNELLSTTMLGGFIFGGYVRDLVAEEEYTDIDIYLNKYYFNRNDITRLLDSINASVYKKKEFFCQIHQLNINDEYMYNPSERREKYNFLWCSDYKNNNVVYNSVDIDLVTNIDGFSPFKDDASVNGLYLSGNKIYEWSHGIVPFTKEEIYEHIKNRKYAPCGNMSEYRKFKIEQKGYTIIQGANIDVKCKQCGRMVYKSDNECWWCECRKPGQY